MMCQAPRQNRNLVLVFSVCGSPSAGPTPLSVFVLCSNVPQIPVPPSNDESSLVMTIN
jgi:hypothetical protein